MKINKLLKAGAIGLMTLVASAGMAFAADYEFDFKTYDNGAGGLWATDYIHAHLELVPDVDNCYFYTRVDTGTFETLDGRSPGDTADILAGIKGDLTGGISGRICGDIRGDMDLSYEEDLTIGSYPSYAEKYFGRILDNISGFTFNSTNGWGWTFTTCNNGTWVDTDTEVSGDITGEYVPCDTTAPEAPTLTSPSNGAYVTGNPTQTWSSVSDADHYIYESYLDVGLSIPAYTTTINGTSRTVGGNQTITFWWRVKSVDAANNESVWSNAWQLNVDNDAPTITFVEPVNDSVQSGLINLKAECNEECDYVNFWWRAEGESYSNTSSDRRYHYVRENGTTFEWGLNSLDAVRWGGDPSYLMTDGTYYLYAAGKDVAGNWARTPGEVMITINNTPDTKEECKDGGWETWLNPIFKNQGKCVSFLQQNENATERNENAPTMNDKAFKNQSKKK